MKVDQKVWKKVVRWDEKTVDLRESERVVRWVERMEKWKVEMKGEMLETQKADYLATRKVAMMVD